MSEPALQFELPNVVVVLARCGKSRRIFGIRIEEKEPARWFADWAFDLPEQQAHKEGYDHSPIHGEFVIDDDYPGCPHCGSAGFFRCRCGKVGCWDEETRQVTCPWCNTSLTLGGSITDLETSPDR